MTLTRCGAFVALIWILDASAAEAQCSYSVSPTTVASPSTTGTRTITVITGTQCTWSAASTVPWITVTSGSGGQGIGSVTFVLAENQSSTARTGMVLVAGQTVTVTQEASSCTYAVTPASFSVSAVSTSRTLSVTTGTLCQWSAISTVTWMTITNPGAGTGVSAVTFSIDANTGLARTGTLTVAGQPVTVLQAGTLPQPSNLRIVR
jgi:Putative binding domain, N-terminal